MPASGRHLPAAGAQWGGVVAVGLVVLALVHVVITRLSWAEIPLQTDTGMWAYIGSRILDGARLYRDLWESKPPGIYYTFAAVIRLFGKDSVTALLWLDAVVSVAVLAVTYRVARRFASRPAAAGAVCLLSVVFCHRVLADWGDNVEKFVALFEMAALLLLIGGLGSRRSMGRFVVAGVCCGLAASFKQTGVVFLLAATITWIGARIWLRAWPGRWKGAIAGLWIGTAIVWVPLVAWMVHAGIFDAFWDQVVRFDLGRMTASESERSRLLTGGHWRGVAAGLKLAAILFGPALMAAVWWGRSLSLTATRTNNASAAPHPGVGDGSGALRLLILCYWVIVTVPFLIAPYGFGHYLLQAAPVAAVMAAWLFDQVFRVASGSAVPKGRHTITAPRSAVRLLTIAVLVGGLVPLADHCVFTLSANSSFRRSYAVLGKRMEALREVVVRATEPDQSVMLWPPDAAVSFYARRRTPLESSNADVIFKGWLPRLSPKMPELLERLQAGPPDVIVDWSRIKVRGPSLSTDGWLPFPTPGGDVAPTLSELGVGDAPVGEPLLLTSPEGYSLLEPPNDAHPRPEGRALAPLKRWVRANYGGQRREGPAVFFFRGRPWRSWEDVLLPRSESSH